MKPLCGLGAKTAVAGWEGGTVLRTFRLEIALQQGGRGHTGESARMPHQSPACQATLQCSPLPDISTAQRREVETSQRTEAVRSDPLRAGTKTAPRLARPLPSQVRRSHAAGVPLFNVTFLPLDRRCRCALCPLTASPPCGWRRGSAPRGPGRRPPLWSSI